MKLKGFDQYINENNEFKPIDVEMFEADVQVKENAVDGIKEGDTVRIIKDKVDPINFRDWFDKDLVVTEVIGTKGQLFRTETAEKQQRLPYLLSIDQITLADVKESVNESVTKTIARKHPMYNRMLKFLARFPDDARSWAEATEEIRDMARTAREYHTELDKDMQFDEWKTNPNAPQPLDFRKIKTPSEWNTEGKKYIIDPLDKMSKQAVDEFMNDFKHWFMLK